MTTFLTILLAWFAVSLPVGLIVGRMLRQAADTQTTPVRSSYYDDYGPEEGTRQPGYAPAATARAYARTGFQD